MRFPSGMKELAADIHALDMKFGMYVTFCLFSKLRRVRLTILIDIATRQEAQARVKVDRGRSTMSWWMLPPTVTGEWTLSR